MANAHSCCQWSAVTWTLRRGGHRRGARQFEAHMRLRLRVKRFQPKRTAVGGNAFNCLHLHFPASTREPCNWSRNPDKTMRHVRISLQVRVTGDRDGSDVLYSRCMWSIDTRSEHAAFQVLFFSVGGSPGLGGACMRFR